MQSHNAYHDPSYSSPAAYNNGAAAALAGSAEPYVHPTIPTRAAACRPVRRGFDSSPAHVGQIRGRQTEPLRQRKGRGLDGGFLPLPDHRAGQQKHRRPPSQAHRIPGSPGEETGAGREGPQEQYLCLSGRGPQLEAPPHRETRHRPLGCPCPVPQGERGAEERDRRAASRAGPADERRNHCSPGTEQWSGDGAPSRCLPQLRNRRFLSDHPRKPEPLLT